MISLITGARSLCEHTASASLILPNVVAAGIRKWDRKTQQEGEQIKNPARTVAVIERLQTSTAPQEFIPRGVFDGVVNFFTLKNMSQSKVLVRPAKEDPMLIPTQTFEVSMSDGNFIDYTVAMNLVGKINPNR